MIRKLSFVWSLLVVLSMLILPAVAAQEDYLAFEGQHDPVWSLKASDGLLIGGYGDNFSYDGSRVVAIGGEAEVLVDVDLDTCTASATFTGTINPEKDKTYGGEIKLVYNQFMGMMPFQEGGVADFVYVHGDTGQGPPVMPKLRTFLGSWGLVDVYVNGELVYQGLDGHVMLTARSRDLTTYAIYANADRTAFYSPMDPSKGYIVAPDEWELHFTAHSDVEDANNFPPHTVWIHLNFGTVEELPPATLPVTGGDAPDASIPYLPLLAAAAGLLLIGGGLVLRRRLAVAKQ